MKTQHSHKEIKINKKNYCIGIQILKNKMVLKGMSLSSYLFDVTKLRLG